MIAVQNILQQENKLQTDNAIPFPIKKMDISWMNSAQKKFYEVLSKDENKKLKYNDISTLAGYKSLSPWYKSIKDERFVQLLERIGVQPKLQNDHYPSHDEVEYIKDPKEREEYLENDVWDMRKLFNEYPRHINPKFFIVDFGCIKNPNIRLQIKRHYKNMLSLWSPITFHRRLQDYRHFFDAMYELFPTLNSLSELKREFHIEPILSSLTISKKQKNKY